MTRGQDEFNTNIIWINLDKKSKQKHLDVRKFDKNEGDNFHAIVKRDNFDVLLLYFFVASFNCIFTNNLNLLFCVTVNFSMLKKHNVLKMFIFNRKISLVIRLNTVQNS